jgi:hypothetical protein
MSKNRFHLARKRARKSRLLWRVGAIPALAAVALFSSACASRAARDPVGSPTSAPTAVSAAPSRDSGDLRWGEWGSQLLPTELELSPELRAACRPFVELPRSIVVEESENVAEALEPLASCLTKGPFARRSIHLAGQTELPGSFPAPVQGSGRADQLRSSLALLGVPFRTLVTYPLPAEHLVEVGLIEDDA